MPTFCEVVQYAVDRGWQFGRLSAEEGHTEVFRRGERVVPFGEMEEDCRFHKNLVASLREAIKRQEEGVA